MSEVFFTIAIPVYNRKEFILDAINSVLVQSFDNFELIIVDNHSTDGTWEFLQTIVDKRVKIFRNDKNIGMVNNWCKCIEYANGKWFKFLMSDDVLLEGALENINSTILKNNASVVLSKGITFSQANPHLPKSRLHDSKQINRAEIIRQIYTYTYDEFTKNPNSYTLKLSDLKELICTIEFNEVLKNLGLTGHVVDYYIFHKVALKYNTINFDNSITYAMRSHEKQASRLYSSDINYHIRGDRYVNNILVDISFFRKLFIFKHLVKNFINKCRLQHIKLYSIIPGAMRFIIFEIYLLTSGQNKFLY